MNSYEDKMNFPMEDLANTLESLGVSEVGQEHGIDDVALIEIAIRKLVMLHGIAKTVMSEELLKVCMKG